VKLTANRFIIHCPEASSSASMAASTREQDCCSRTAGCGTQAAVVVAARARLSSSCSIWVTSPRLGVRSSGNTRGRSAPHPRVRATDPGTFVVVGDAALPDDGRPAVQDQGSRLRRDWCMYLDVRLLQGRRDTRDTHVHDNEDRSTRIYSSERERRLPGDTNTDHFDWDRRWGCWGMP
jgi:hypothetical protein